MSGEIAFLGFGEAAQAFAGDPRWRAEACGFDIKIESAALAAEKRRDFERCGVQCQASLSAALAEARVILSLVTADQAGEAARAAARVLSPGALFLDMNSVSPTTKQAAAVAVEGCGATYLDVAIMSPVLPARLDAPLLVSGRDGEVGVMALRDLGFSAVRAVGDAVGRASLIKMTRSVFIKGIEAVAAECLLAAHAGGVEDEVIASLSPEWPEKLNYALDRCLVHGERRAAEMEEVAQTLRDLGIEPLMTERTATRQRELGSLAIRPAPPSLGDKLTRIAALRQKTSR